MSPFLEKVGVSIASRIGITAAIAAIVAALLGGGYWWVKTLGPRDTVKARETGVKVEVEDLCFYGAHALRVDGKVYRTPSTGSDEPRPVVIYCQDRTYGDSWCRDLAGLGAVAYCFDFQRDGEKARLEELETALSGIRSLRYVDKDRIYLLGEGGGCLAAATLAAPAAIAETGSLSEK